MADSEIIWRGGNNLQKFFPATLEEGREHFFKGTPISEKGLFGLMAFFFFLLAV